MRTQKDDGLRIEVRPHLMWVRIRIYGPSKETFVVRHGGKWGSTQALEPDPSNDTPFLSSIFEQLALPLLEFMKLRNIGHGVICIEVNRWWQAPRMYLVLRKMLNIAATASSHRVSGVKVVWR